jgi:asparagine synthase (glutamine-hydrolysing)
MCGIVGHVRCDEAPASLGEQLAAIRHRGPDGEGTFFDVQGEWRVALGHRRLAIIDLRTGAQPMSNPRGDVHLTYNGEVYNFRALRRELEARGSSFATRSDTEVVLRQYEVHGEAGVAKLDGMFAFGIWDASRRRLLLARDRVGIKPLYYASLPGGGVAFASELTALLLALPPAPVSVSALVSYFFSDYVHAPEAMVRGVRKLPPGHTVVWEDGRLGEPKAYWRVPSCGPSPRATDDELAHELWERIGDAVGRQLVSDVPVGVFLSGGVDSSSVAAQATRHAAGRMKAFAIGFEDATYDESAYARRVAEQFGLEYVEERLSEHNLIDVVDAAIDHLDEPLADPSLVPTYLLCRLAARHVKVVLGGDGGDDVWAGYPTYRAYRYARAFAWLPRRVRRDGLARLVGRMPLDDKYQSLEWKLRRFTERWDDDPVRRHLRWMSCLDLPDLQEAIPAGDTAHPATLLESAGVPETGDALGRILSLDFVTYLPGSILTKVDRASMAHGLEVRPPLLDGALVDWAFALPTRYKLRRGCTKFLLKRAATGTLPDAIIRRPKKGFGIPLARWMRGPLADRMRDIVASSAVWNLGLVDRSTFERYHREHASRQVDRSKPLWALYVLDHWLERHKRHVRMGAA